MQAKNASKECPTNRPARAEGDRSVVGSVSGIYLRIAACLRSSFLPLPNEMQQTFFWLRLRTARLTSFI